MSKYVDGFVIPVPKANVEAYREMSRKAGEVWMEYGALAYYEAVGEDLAQGEMVSFPQIAGAGEDETVVFAWIVYASRADRDRINAAVIEDERIKNAMGPNDAPFDYKRMAYGGFETIVEFAGGEAPKSREQEA